MYTLTSGPRTEPLKFFKSKTQLGIADKVLKLASIPKEECYSRGVDLR